VECRTFATSYIDGISEPRPAVRKDNSLKRHEVQKASMKQEASARGHYLKPGEKKRLKQALAQKRARKKIRKESA
jgi:small subunit ribosomal protein S21